MMGEQPKTEHTPEPWRFVVPDSAITMPKGCTLNAYIGCRKDGCVALLHAHPPVDFANGRRIVACVNGCQGINPAAVPDLLSACKDVVNTEDMLDESEELHRAGLLVSTPSRN